MYVYVFMTANACKVGISKDPVRRMADLQAATFEAIKIARTFEVREDRALAIERAAQRALAAKHWRRGEWFKTSVEECCSAVEDAIQKDAAPPMPRASVRDLMRDIRKDEEINRLYRLSIGLDKEAGPGPSGEARRRRERANMGVTEDRT